MNKAMLFRYIVISVTLILFSCGSSRKVTQPVNGVVNDLKFAFYNIENLFDLKDDPHKNDDDFTPGGKLQWNEERYNKKLSNLAYVIERLGGDNTSPDILGLCEVENVEVLKDLVKQQAIKSRNYQIIHFDSPDERGIDVALLYDPKVFQPHYQNNIRITLPGSDSTTRDVLLVKGTINNIDTFTVVVNHWPSRRNPEETRLITARKVRQVIDSTFNNSPQARILLMGDFNDEPTDESLKILMQGNEPNKNLFNAMSELKNQGLGTHEYRKNWHMLDQFVYSSSLQNGNWKYVTGSAQVFKPDFLQEGDGPYKGSPYRTYVGNKYLGGYSDHFPIMIRFKRTQN